jgi:coenzyme PQQ precursor peptide PqqA
MKTKTTWKKPAFSLTSTGFEVTMYLGTQTGAR